MASTFFPLERPLRLSDQVVAAIKAQIEGGSLRPGMRLPSEVALAVRLGVSRPVLREGLARLRADGFLSSRRGAGIVIADRPGVSSFRIGDEVGATSPAELIELFEVRGIVEVSATALAAERHTAADMTALEAAMGRMQDAIGDGADGSDADEAFHGAIAKATQNAQLICLVTVLGAAFADTRRPSWTPAGHAAGLAAAAQDEHRAILAAIRARDKNAAADAARRHLDRSAARTGLGSERPTRTPHESE